MVSVPCVTTLFHPAGRKRGVLVGWGREGGITCGKIVFDTGYPESFGGKLSPLPKPANILFMQMFLARVGKPV
jgi:hypothetical protein